MTLTIGSPLPSATFHTMHDSGPTKFTTEQLIAKGKIVLIGVPGAFTPTCHTNHLPAFIENLDAFTQFGIDCIAVTAVNDIHVFHAWSKAIHNSDKILFLADGNAQFATACGLNIDLSVALMGQRSRRYAMVIDQGILTHLNIEDQPGVAEKSSSAALLESLKN